MNEPTSCPEVGNRHLLLAVDESPYSHHAVDFVGDLFGSRGDCRITLLHVVQKPAAEQFADPAAAVAWTEVHTAMAQESLDEARERLVQRGIPAARIEAEVEVIEVATVADAILAARQRLACCTVVVGRRRLSRQEEFLYGSTSNRILHEAHGCAVLVVQS